MADTVPKSTLGRDRVPLVTHELSPERVAEQMRQRLAAQAGPRPYVPESALSRAELAAELVRRLEAAGFARDTTRRSGERVYTRGVSRPGRSRGQREPLEGVSVEVFTTIVETGHGCEVRELGKDAIRVCAVHRHADPETGKTKRRGLVKEARVFRTGKIEEIAERAIERARKVWAAVLERPTCRDCGCVTFESRKGNDVCAKVCFAQTKGGNMRQSG